MLLLTNTCIEKCPILVFQYRSMYFPYISIRLPNQSPSIKLQYMAKIVPKFEYKHVASNAYYTSSMCEMVTCFVVAAIGHQVGKCIRMFLCFQVHGHVGLLNVFVFRLSRIQV